MNIICVKLLISIFSMYRHAQSAQWIFLLLCTQLLWYVMIHLINQFITYNYILLFKVISIDVPYAWLSCVLYVSSCISSCVCPSVCMPFYVYVPSVRILLPLYVSSFMYVTTCMSLNVYVPPCVCPLRAHVSFMCMSLHMYVLHVSISPCVCAIFMRMFLYMYVHFVRISPSCTCSLICMSLHVYVSLYV